MAGIYDVFRGSRDYPVRNATQVPINDPLQLVSAMALVTEHLGFGIHLSEPSPQRTPMIFQAGASTRGRRFAARHAEAVFVGAPSKHVLKGYVESIRRVLSSRAGAPMTSSSSTCTP